MDDSLSFHTDAFLAYLTLLLGTVILFLGYKFLSSVKEKVENNRPFRKYLNIKLNATESAITSLMPLSKLKQYSKKKKLAGSTSKTASQMEEG